MQILNAGNRVVSTYLYPIEHGYVMIDTGYENAYPAFARRLFKLGIQVSDIRYVFLTHAHDDHAGFLNELLEQVPHIQVIASQLSIYNAHVRPTGHRHPRRGRRHTPPLCGAD